MSNGEGGDTVVATGSDAPAVWQVRVQLRRLRPTGEERRLSELVRAACGVTTERQGRFLTISALTHGAADWAHQAVISERHGDAGVGPVERTVLAPALQEQAPDSATDLDQASPGDAANDEESGGIPMGRAVFIPFAVGSALAVLGSAVGVPLIAKLGITLAVLPFAGIGLKIVWDGVDGLRRREWSSLILVLFGLVFVVVPCYGILSVWFAWGGGDGGDRGGD